MNSILIRNVQLNGTPTDVYVSGNIITKIEENLPIEADLVIDGKGKAIIPGLINMHTHAAMTLFRGYGDDMPLMPWLHEKIWPNEAKLTDEDVYWGAKLACLEMIKTGTTSFLDMYTHFESTACAVDEMGIRGFLSKAGFDFFIEENTEKAKREMEQQHLAMDKYSNRVQFSVGPHAIYTVSGKLLRWFHDFAKANQLLVHLHLSETEQEVEDCLMQNGKRPVQYLHSLGILSPSLVLAHGVHFDEEEMDLLAEHGVSVVHNPAANMKLASGERFYYEEMKKRGIRIGLGTDGCSSSNNLDMIETMKLAALLGKVWRRDAEAVSAPAIFDTATIGGAEILGLNAGRIEEGCLADFSLVDLCTPALAPNHNFISNLVYAANGSCIDTLVCNGKVLMQGKHVDGEEEIIRIASERAYDLMKR